MILGVEMDNVDLQISNALQTAISKAQIVGHFQYGHNLLQSSVQIDEVFSMLDTIIKEVLETIDDVIPDINLAPYKDGMIDSSRANLCWIELKDNYYGLILNTLRGIKYRPFDEEDIQNLLLNGQSSSWYLISKIQNLSYLLMTDKTDQGSAVEFFRKLIIDIVERFFYDHEHDMQMHPAGAITVSQLNKLFSRLQTQNSNSIIAAKPIEEERSGDGTWSQSLIKTPSHEICWQSAPDLKLRPMSPAQALYIISSKYLNDRSDVEIFLKETYEKRKGNTGLPNVFCFLSRGKFDIPYVDLNYVVECQLRGYIEVEYNDGTTEKIYPDTQPFVIEKSKNNVSFMIAMKLDNDMAKKISNIVTFASTDSGDDYLPNMNLICSCTGISEKYE